MRLVIAAAVLVACSPEVTNVGPDAAVTNPDGMLLVDATPPSPAGCIDDVSTGDHVYTCEGLRVDARVPAACQAPGCGLILVLHGDTGSGLLMEGHVKLRELGEQYGYVVIAPSGPPWRGPQGGSTWSDANDDELVAITEQFASVYRVDPKKVHVTGFSRGAFVTWRLLCDHSDLFASAAPGGAGFGGGFGETTCFQNGRAPTRKLPLLILMGRTDVSVGYDNLVGIRDAAVADYGATGPVTLASDASYRHDRWTGTDVIETFDHSYETVGDGPFGDARGHCIPGSTSDPYATQYAIPCELPNTFVWGEEVMRFFRAHPMP
jgi:polyhydroxybutyrate depolymerase